MSFPNRRDKTNCYGVKAQVLRAVSFDHSPIQGDFNLMVLGVQSIIYFLLHCDLLYLTV